MLNHRLRDRFVPVSVRGRLLLAFSVLAVAAAVLAVVGWRGLTNTERALIGFEERILPEVSRSLAIAERTANLAALAPYVAETSAPFQLRGESERLREKVANVLTLARSIPEAEVAAPHLSPLLGEMEGTLDELIRRTRTQLFLREDLREHLFRLDRAAERYAGDAAVLTGPVAAMADVIRAGAAADTTEGLTRFRRRAEQRLEALAGTRPEIAAALTGMTAGDGNVFDLRAEQLALEQRKAYLLARTRAISERLSREVATYVERLQERVTAQSGSVSRAVQSGKTGIAVIALMSAVGLALGVLIVRRLVGHLGAVTDLMSRLAEGVTESQTPATDRRDELGALARAFHVFRGNALALRAQTRLLETVFNNINDGLSVFDRDGRLVTWNPQYLQILELPPERIRVGMSLESVQALLPPVTHENRTLVGSAVTMSDLNSRRLEAPQSFERHYANGRVVAFRSRPMPDGGFVTLYSDLTDRKAVEAQLRQSQKMEVLGQLTGGVAHDFNNLLAAVIGNLQMLDSRPDLDERTARLAQRALAAAERGAGLTERLLAFARRQQLRPEAVPVDRLLAEMLDLVEYSVDADVRVTVSPGTGDAEVNVDRGQLENALLNLAINASAAMPQGGRLGFATRLETGEDGREYVCIDVSDTGHGIPDAERERVFEPFFTTREIGEGSGLGLSIVYGFVRQSGGDVRLDSREGVGTTVSLFLPRHRSDTVGAVQLAAPAPTEPLPPLAVLLVEDDDQVRAMSVDMLETLGHVVVAVVSEGDALAALDEAPFDLVLSDVNLGEGGNGNRLRERLALRQPELPVLLTSGLSRAHLSERYGLPDDVILLHKPYGIDALTAAMRAALGGEPGRETAGRPG